MTANSIPWIVAGAGLAAALVLFVRLRATRLEVAQRGVEAEKLQAELQAARKQLEKASAKQRHSGDELAELRRRLEKARRRAAQVQTQSAGRGAAPSHLQGLEEELEQTRQARDAAREEVQGLSAELSRLRAERAQPAPSEPAPEPTPEPTPEPPAESEVIAALRERAEAAEARVGSLEKDLAGASHATDRLRNKVKTQESLYLAMRGELEAKKDRLRRQQEELERLRAFKVAVVDPLPPASVQPEPSAADLTRSDPEPGPADAPAESESPVESGSPEPSADEVAGGTPETV